MTNEQLEKIEKVINTLQKDDCNGSYYEMLEEYKRNEITLDRLKSELIEIINYAMNEMNYYTSDEEEKRHQKRFKRIYSNLLNTVHKI